MGQEYLPNAVLALELRLRRFGYAVFEGPRRLLDSGSSWQIPAGRDPASATQKRLSELVRVWSPEAIVVKTEQWEIATTLTQAKYLAQVLTYEAEQRRIDIRLLKQEQLNQTFRDCRTKFDIASSLALTFPELVWRLPTERRTWESEAARMVVFDAIAAGLAYWMHDTTSVLLRKDRWEQDDGMLEPFRRPLG